MRPANAGQLNVGLNGSSRRDLREALIAETANVLRGRLVNL